MNFIQIKLYICMLPIVSCILKGENLPPSP